MTLFDMSLLLQLDIYQYIITSQCLSNDNLTLPKQHKLKKQHDIAD